jgi:30S ribosomal protein S31
MGKGDRKTAKGKRNISSYGNARKAVAPTKVATKAAAPAKGPAVKKAPAKKAAAK